MATVEFGLITGIHKGTATIRGTAGKLFATVQVVVAGTLHQLGITASESWTTENGPHVVDSVLAVGGSGSTVLSVGPGVTVYFKPKSGLDIGKGGPATLLANGAAASIVLRALSDTASAGTWRNLTFRGAGRSELVSVTLRSCGLASDGLAGCILLRHPPFGAEAPIILVDNVAVEQATGAAIVLEGKSRFVAGSKRLSVNGLRGHVATMTAAAVGDFPVGGTFTNIDSNEVRVLSDTVSASATWANQGFLWHVLGLVTVEGPASPVLTIPAGSNMRLSFGAGFVIGQNGPGALLVGESSGTAVTMAADGPNEWVGFQFWSHAKPSAVANTTLRNCGRYSNTGYGEGCIFFIGDFAGNGPAPVFTKVTLDSANNVAVTAVGGGRFGAGSSELTITHTHGIPFEIPLEVLPTLPTGSYTGNDDDQVRLTTYEVHQSLTLRNIGIPYVIRQGLGVEGPANPVLTIDPGVVIRFSPGNYLIVGRAEPGTIRALGTAAAPVRFTTNIDPAFQGSWMRIVLGAFAGTNSLLDHAVVEYAGGEDRGSAAVEFAKDIGPVLRNSLLQLSAGCGVLRATGVTWTTDFTAPSLGNRFEQNAGPAQCGP